MEGRNGVAENEQRGLNLLDFGLFYLVDGGKKKKFWDLMKFSNLTFELEKDKEWNREIWVFHFRGILVILIIG